MKAFLRRALSSFAASALFLIAFAGLALAHGHGHHWGQWGHAPEIDPSLIGSGLALLGGGILLLIEKYRRR